MSYPRREKNMKIEKASLIKALEIVKPGLAAKENIEQSTSFAFMGGRVVTYNDEISISHPVSDLDIEGAVRAEEMYQLLGKMKSKEVQLAVTETEIRIKSGKARAGITLQSEIKLPLEEIGDIGKWKKIPEELLQAMKFTMFSCSTDMSKPVLTCVHVTPEGRVESCNNYQVTRFQMKDKLPIGEFLIPVGTVKSLIAYDVTHISEGHGWVHFKTKEDTIFSCRVFEDTYVNLEGIMEVSGNKIHFPENLGTILDRAAVFSKRERWIDEVIEISIDPEGKMKIRSEDDAGWFEETTTLGEGKWEEVSFKINPLFLKDILSQNAPCVVGDHKVKFTGENWVHILALQK